MRAQSLLSISEIYLSSSADGAHSFGTPVLVSPGDGRSSWSATVAVSGLVVHVAWTDDRYTLGGMGRPYDCGTVGGGPSCHEDEFYRRSTDHSATFSQPEVRLTIDPPTARKEKTYSPRQSVRSRWVGGTDHR